MHVVQCPKCSSQLKVPQAISNARLKCRKCGVVFMATSRQVPEAGPAAPWPAPATPQPGPPVWPTRAPIRPPRQGSDTIIFVTIGLVVLLVGIAVAMIVKLKSESNDKQPVAARKGDAPSPRPGTTVTQPAEPPDVKPPHPPVLDTPPAPPVQPGPVEPPEPERAPGLTVDCQLVQIGLPGSERLFIQGGVRNDRSEGLQSVTVNVRLPVPKRDKPREMLIECLYVPPGMRIPFLVTCPLTTLEGGAKPPADAVAAEPLAAKQICWAVEEAATVRGDEAGETYTIRGAVKNPKDVFVSNIEVHVDVYYADGRHAGSAQGALEHGRSLPAYGRDDFSIRFQPKAVGTHMQRPVVRAVGTVP